MNEQLLCNTVSLLSVTYKILIPENERKHAQSPPPPPRSFVLANSAET